MPGISNIIQKIRIKTCIAFDILAGCAGFINAIDIAQKYIETTTAKSISSRNRTTFKIY